MCILQEALNVPEGFTIQLQRLGTVEKRKGRNTCISKNTIIIIIILSLLLYNLPFTHTCSHGGNISELVRLQSEELHHVKGVLNEYIYQISQLQVSMRSCTSYYSVMMRL